MDDVDAARHVTLRDAAQELANRNALRVFREGVEAVKAVELLGPTIAANILGISRATLYRRMQLGRGILTSNDDTARQMRRDLGLPDEPQAHKVDKIKAALELRRDENLSSRAIAQRLGVSQSTASRWLRTYQLDG